MTDTTDTARRASPCRERHDEIVAWLGQGLSRREIALKLHVSTNTVIGYCYAHVSPEVAKTRPRKTRHSPPPAPKPRVERRGSAIPARLIPVPTVERAKHVPVGPGVAFPDLERGDRKCRWPFRAHVQTETACAWPRTQVGPQIYCGAQTEPGESYCKECHRVGWMPRVREVK